MGFRQRVITDFAIVFDENQTDEKRIKFNGDFANKWGWFGVMYRLTDGKIVNLQKVAKLELLECLTWLSYETDLEEQNKVQING